MSKIVKKSSKTTVWWVLLAAVVLTFLLMLIPKESVKVDPNILPWNSYFNENNELVALGITLNKSTTNDALKLFGNDYEVLVFSKKDESGKVVEIYFPTMTLERLRGVVTLVLDVPDKELSAMYERGTTTTINQAGNRQVTLQSEDSESLMDNKIKYLTFVPKNSLSEEVLKGRFGEPAQIKSAEDGLMRWLYPQKGLEIIVNPKGAEVLQYHSRFSTLSQ
jgi:hypothetical protein